MTDIGTLLRTTRESQSLTLEEVEHQTHIRYRFLEALEKNHFDALGGDLYLRGFLRNYAAFLGLDPEPLLAELGPPPDPLPGKPAPRFPSRFEPHYLSEPLESNPVPVARLFSMLLLALFMMAIAYLIWWQPAAERDALLSRLGLPLMTPTSSGAVASAGSTPTVGGVQVITQTTIIEPYSSPTPEGQPTPVPTATLPPRTPTPDLNASPTVPPTPELVSGVVLKGEVIADTWVRVLVDSQNEPLVEGMLSTGQTFEWVGNEEIRLRVGNAAGLSVTLNGQPIGLLGQAGQVLERHWRRNPDGGPPILVEPQS